MTTPRKNPRPPPPPPDRVARPESAKGVASAHPPQPTPPDSTAGDSQSPHYLTPGAMPHVTLRSAAYHPFIYKKMIDRADPSARPGDLVAVYGPRGDLFGHGLYNPRSQIVVRMLTFGPESPTDPWWHARLASAVALRRDILHLDQTTDAYRLIHAEGDSLTGWVVDRFADVLSAEVFSLGIYHRIESLLPTLGQLCGTRHHLVQVDDRVQSQEGFAAVPLASPDLPRRVEIHENGVRFRVYFEEGHKTGFFCDQRDNRRRLAELCRDKSVLDLCCYTGGFALAAKVLGHASDVTAVDLDERAVAVARENANLNQARITFTHADVFPWMRDALANRRSFDVVVLDPPKLIPTRRDLSAGKRKYFDLNRLALSLLRPGGLFLTCSCSGLLPPDEFLSIVRAAARQPLTSLRHTDPMGVPRVQSAEPLPPHSTHGVPRVQLGEPVPPGSPHGVAHLPPAEPLPPDNPTPDVRRLQLLYRTSAAPDHPVALDCPETDYLKALWFRVS